MRRFDAGGLFRQCSRSRATLPTMFCPYLKSVLIDLQRLKRSLKIPVVNIPAFARTLVLGLVFVWVPGQSVLAETVQLRYEAYLGGALAGSAQLALSQDAQRYSVIGSAKSKGLMDSFNPWRAQFEARGTVADGLPQLDQYHYVESDSRKLREVTVSDGQLRVVKNGKLRAELDALPGMDILTALFVEPSCDAALDLHTGRRGYRLVSPSEAANGSADTCRYTARDEDGDKTQVSIEFVRIGELRVPRVIELSGFLSGRLKLESYQLTKLAATAP
jgi:hypothetical protein